ncbi:CAP domain-containing protein [Haloferula chungangensis]|uniref:CAP domain-containing protein n=1 Tax=Haloferula chungangensis TaxID=1048331 RepID=A0ABW2L7V8_9BACT
MVKLLPLFLLVLLPRVEAEVYSIGDPTADEQYLVELINRARANPEAEGILLAETEDPAILYAISYFGVSLDQFKSEMAAIPPKPPLAINPILTSVARGHSEYMFSIGQQTHIDGSGLAWNLRGEAAGYTDNLVVENITDSSESNDYGHASFEIDWGEGGSGGMQLGRPHRISIHYDNLKEVGVGVSYGSKVTEGGRAVGPQQITQDFGLGPAGMVFITGVVYADINENDFYDPGEGIGGVEVLVEGSENSGITASSGGYAVPVPEGNATYELTFLAPGIQSQASAVVSGENVKVDLVLEDTAAAVVGTTAPAVGIPTVYQVSPVPGATSYEWQKLVESPALNDSAEDLSRVTTTGSDEFSMLATDVKYEGSSSYHLFHDDYSDRALTYQAGFKVGAEGAISFQSRLVYALEGEVAKVQVSDDGGNSWSTVWSQAGSQGLGDVDFQLRSVSLSEFSGKEVRLRFLFDFLSGAIYGYPIGQPIGWYVDAIQFTDITTLSGEMISSVDADGTFEFEAESPGDFVLAARPLFPGRTGTFGPLLAVEASVQNSYAAYASAQEAAFDLPASSILNNPEGDANDDGVANVMAYAMGLSPMDPACHLVPRAEEIDGQLVIHYTTHPSRTDLSYGAEAATGLEGWVSPGEPGAPEGFSDQILSSEGNTVNRRAALSIGATSAAFMRMNASLK